MWYLFLTCASPLIHYSVPIVLCFLIGMSKASMPHRPCTEVPLSLLSITFHVSIPRIILLKETLGVIALWLSFLLVVASLLDTTRMSLSCPVHDFLLSRVSHWLWTGFLFALTRCQAYVRTIAIVLVTHTKPFPPPRIPVEVSQYGECTLYWCLLKFIRGAGKDALSFFSSEKNSVPIW